MPASPIEAEARGQEFVTAEYGGRSWRLPLDVDSWPLDTLLTCLGVDDEKRLVVNYPALIAATRELLAEQWDAFLEAAPKRRDLVPASHVFAEAVGIGRRDGYPIDDVAFGAIPALLFNLQHHPGPVEATLAALGVDYRDRWRFDEDGRRRLTLRQIHIRLTYAPYDSPLAIALNGSNRPLSDAALATYDLFEAHTGKAHPARLKSLPTTAARDRVSAEEKRAQAVADYKARHKPSSRLKSAAETARANAALLMKGNAHAEAHENRSLEG